MASDRRTELVVFFIFLSMIMLLISFIFRGFIPSLANSILDRPESSSVSALTYAGALIKLMVFSVPSDLYVLSIILDAYSFMGMFIIVSYILDR